ncbi:hypothetical protein K9L97_02120 [Candidatus Woesearchaeota archaeon]|nr:hypothetical protein [Candidatus Woesearchaeota archaeon]
MTKQKQIKITVSEKADKLIEKRAKKLGMNKASYCYNLIFEKIRKELENEEDK